MILCAFVICFCVAWFLLVRTFAEDGVVLSSSSTHAVKHVELDMHIEPLGESLMITWKRQGQLVASAQKGVLRVRDGDRQRDISLDARQIANGVVLYKPQSSTISFSLQLEDTAATRWSDSVRFTSNSTTRQPPLRGGSERGVTSLASGICSALPDASV